MVTMSKRITLMALDSMWPVGRALARVLQRDESINWTGLAIDTATWRDMLLCFQPDVALIDPLGFGRTTADLVRLTRSVSPETKVVIFTPTLAEPIVQRWYDAGADACIMKTLHPDLILEVVKDVRRETFSRAALAERLFPLSATGS